MQTRHQKQLRCSHIVSSQKGYILIITIVLLSVLLIMSLNFFKRTADSLQMSGYNRESTESLVIAESAMNFLYGRYIYNADLDGKNGIDIDVKINPSKPNEIDLPYLYYVSSDGSIDQKNPSLLQKIANGEARNIGATINNHEVAKTTERLQIMNLYSNKAKPIVFQFNALNQIEQTETEWSAVSGNNSKAAVAWLELVKNEELEGTVQVYVQAVGKVGTSKSYVQRLIGYIPTTLGSIGGNLIQAGIKGQ